jgi:hypothetical protein
MMNMTGKENGREADEQEEETAVKCLKRNRETNKPNRSEVW